MDTINKLQFKHHSEIITASTLQEAEEAVKSYIYNQWFDTAAYNDPNSDYRSLYAEPTVFRYAVEGEEDEKTHIMLLIGAETNDGSREDYNKFCIINIDKTEQEIADLAEELEKAIKSLTVVALDTNTLDLHAEKTDEGTFVSGDVKTAAFHMFDDIKKYNNLMVADGEEGGPEGLFIYVDLTYDEATESFTFVVTNADGTLKKQEVKLPNNYLVSGRYSVQDQSLHLKMKNGDDVVVDCTYLIAEWDTERDGSKTPIVLVKEPVGYGEETEYNHLEPWQDVLRADIRLKDEIKDEETGKYTKDPNSSNILERTLDGRSLYVDGKASNIIYYWNGEKSNVKDQLDKFNQIGVSDDADNIIWNRADKFFAAVKLDYDSTTNSLTFTTSNVNEPHMRVKNIPLNTVEVFKYIYYDATTEELVLAYTNDKGEEKVVRIPLSGMIDEWDVLNEAHSVYLKKQRNVSGKDLLSADVKISGSDNNILTEINHELYVRGTSDNIKYDVTGNTTVKDVLDGLKAEDEALNDKIDNEIARSEAADKELTDKIGTGFTSDPHDNVTYKFEQLQNQVNTEAEKLQNEIDRSTEKDAEHDEKLAEQQAEIEAISADSANSLKDIINNDHSIDIDKTDAVRPIISLNISSEDDNTIRLVQEDGKYGIYNYVDLSYDPSGNTLTFTRSDKNSIDKVIKTIQLDTISFIEDIYYDPDHDELVIIYYSGHERKEVRVPLRGLIDEWTTSDNTDGAIKLTKIPAPTPNDKDILYGEVLISDIHGNILENENGKLFVSNSGITANTAAIEGLTTRLESEIERSIAKDDEHDAAINTINNRLVVIDDDIADLNRDLTNEINRSTAKDTELETAIADERARAEAADRELYQKIADETVARASGDTMLQSQLDQEISRATMKEGEIERNLQSEIERSTAEDQRLSDALQQEITDREQGDAELAEAIRAATLTFDDTSSIDFNIPSEENNIVRANVKLQEGDNIIKLGSGLYATVNLSYDSARNTIKLVTSNGEQEAIQLNTVGSLIDGMEYDAVNRALVIKYHDAEGNPLQVSFPVNQLFNDWEVDNPSSNSAIKLTKTSPVEPDDPDKLSAQALITDDFNGDGKPDEGSDNIIEIRNNGLYVCGSAMTESQEIAKCVQNEIKVLEKAVIGHIIGEECGSGYTYEPNTMATYINSANSFNNADYILDQSIKNVENKVDEVSAKTDCVDNATKKIYEVLYGEGTAMPECGEGVHYQPYVGACIISAATSFNEADQMLNDQICELLEMWVSGMTCTTESNWIDEGANKKMQVDVRPSYGNDAEMTEDDLYIHDQVGDFIEPGVTEFTDTNALRIVCLTEGGSVIPDVKSKQNGLYLSNVWDCGMYYSPSDTEAKAAAEEAGYITDPYSTDEDSSASGFNYMNNVRQTDIPVE